MWTRAGSSDWMMRMVSRFSNAGRWARVPGPRGDRGFTLVEITISMGIFAVAIIGVLLMLVAAQAMEQEAKNMTQAVQDARTILERIRLDVEVNANMTTFADAYPASTYEGWVTNQQAAETEFVNLQDEVVDVTFANPGADPLDVTVEVGWTDRGGRQRSTTLQTQMSYRTGASGGDDDDDD